MKRFAIALSVLALALPLMAQTPAQSSAQTSSQTWVQNPAPPYSEKIDVNAVLLDVIVTDKHGNQILGLDKNDFVVKENGVAQPIDSVDYLTNRRLLDEREEAAPFKVEHVSENRYFIFFFDKPTDSAALFSELSQARQAVRDFVRDEMKPNDLVAVAGHDVRLKIYTDFTSDKKQISRALDEVTRWGVGVTKAPAGDGPSILRSIGKDAMIDDTGTVYRALDLLADSLRPIRARKNLVLFSAGIADIHEPIFHGMITSRSNDLDPMLESLNAANVSVYGVQLQRTNENPRVATEPMFHQRLAEISESTGGRYFQFNTSFDPAVRRIENTNAGYYLVTYRSPHPTGESGYQKVNVTVKNPEFKVVARSGYQFGG
jgi:VWFA-related protein